MSLFLRKTNRKDRLYLQIYESFRDPSSHKPRTRCVRTLGYLDAITSEQIPDPITYYEEQIRQENERSRLLRAERSAGLISDIPPFRYLGYFPVQSILRKLDVARYIDLLFSSSKVEFSVSDCLFQLIYARIVNPSSKLHTCRQVIPMLFQSSTVSYDQILGCLEMCGHDYEKIVELFSSAVDDTYILDTSKTFFDCTNFYFEIDREDQWRKKDPSKENKHDPILGMGLLLDANCIPVGMKLYPGNASEKPVLRSVISALKEQNNIHGRTVTVADKGLNCARNIHEAIQCGDGYIFSKSVKQLSEVERTWALLENGYTSVSREDGSEKFRVKSAIDTFSYSYEDDNGRRVRFSAKEKRVATYNPKLARKQRNEILKLADKARYMCLSRAKKEEMGESAKYVVFSSVDKNGEKTGKKAVPSINQEKIDKDLACAGYNLLVTSESQSSELDIYDTYHELWRIEESFRTLKSELDARPVYLQTADKIKGHFLVCYLCVLLERLFQFKVLENQYGSHQVYKFIRNFQVIPMGGGLYMNVSTTNEVMEFLAQKFNLPLRVAKLKERQIEKILDRNI